MYSCAASTSPIETVGLAATSQVRCCCAASSSARPRIMIRAPVHSIIAGTDYYPPGLDCTSVSAPMLTPGAGALQLEPLQTRGPGSFGHDGDYAGRACRQR